MDDTFAFILMTYDAIWTDGTILYDSGEMLRVFDRGTLNAPARLKENTLVLLDPVTGIERGGFALLKVTP